MTATANPEVSFGEAGMKLIVDKPAVFRRCDFSGSFLPFIQAWRTRDGGIRRLKRGKRLGGRRRRKPELAD
jgi:hypothetical protein